MSHGAVSIGQLNLHDCDRGQGVVTVIVGIDRRRYRGRKRFRCHFLNNTGVRGGNNHVQGGSCVIAIGLGSVTGQKASSSL